MIFVPSHTMPRGRKGVASRRTKKSGTNDKALAGKRDASAAAAAAAALVAPEPLQEPLPEPPLQEPLPVAELVLSVREPVCRNAQEEKLRRAAIEWAYVQLGSPPEVLWARSKEKRGTALKIRD